ncbi:zinc finger HIT domain-containing protein 2 [Fukomys damarensis]|uniref:zinc finger HIT domain-containing protein 2 n=1 Tax=Fukomys damarensis TaxID=885580 RepID=UPI0014550A8E|nr:zinc finger HIT domain-containing protein 2 [Fukomys damarensis]
MLGSPGKEAEGSEATPEVTKLRPLRILCCLAAPVAMEPAGPCGFCPAGEAQPARYTCPRCNVPYCSLNCYREHGTCAEAFYRDQVLGELRGRSASPSRLAGALRRLRQQRETEDVPGEMGLGPGPGPGGLSGLRERLALYHGGDDALLSDFCATLLGVSGALGAQQVFASAEEALQAAAHVLEAGEHPPGPLGTRGAMQESARILWGEDAADRKGYTLAALGHLAQTLGRARKQALAQEERNRLYRARKKCQFLLAWTNENEAVLMPLALDCTMAYRAHAVAAEEVAALTEEMERLWGGPVPPAPKTLIEELPG